jgi:hypothetical protein
MEKSMDPNVLTAIISASASAAVAITALILNSRGFTSLENRMTALENRMTAMETRIHSDLQEFYRILTDHDRRIQRLEDKK